MSATLAQQIAAIGDRTANLQALLLGTRDKGLFYAITGSNVVFGCKVTQGYSGTNMVLGLDGSRAGDESNFNPDKTANPVRPEEYENIALIYGEVFLSKAKNISSLQDTSLVVSTAPGAGFHRYDIVYAYVSDSGPSVGIAAGSPVANASTPTDPVIPQGTLALARVHVESGVTAITDAKITDIRDFSGRLRGTDGAAGATGPAYSASDLAEIVAVKEAAALSESNALSYKNSASDSANTATTKASDAAADRVQTGLDRTSATTSAATATTKAGEASTSASTASTKAGEASASAATASTKAEEASASAATATTKAGEASTSAATATTKASEASTSATNAATKASEALASAEAALAASNATTWVSGTTYALNANVISPTSHLTYRRKIAGAGTTDPSIDSTNWLAIGGVTTGVNTGDETTATIKSKLGISILSGANTGDQTIPTTLPASDVSAWAKAGTKPTYTKLEVGLENVDNTSDSAKPVSTAQQTALDLKANLASPTFTGTVAGITKAMVGLGNVDNTSDATVLAAAAAASAPSSHVGSGSSAHSNAVSGGDAGFMSGVDKSKLDGIAVGATNYTHPANHAASVITQDASNRFVTDEEKATWNAKGSGDVTLAGTQTLTNKTISGADNTLTVDGTNAVGFRHIPQLDKTSAYELVLTDAGKHIHKGGTGAFTVTIPANASVAFPIGTAITFVNSAASGAMTIAITTDTMRLAGAGTTGSRTLAAYGVATAIKVTSTLWMISGTNLT